jgi:alanyl-tRNA synthetase
MGPQAPVSIELCGGCHVANTREIRAFHIVKEEAIAAGIRRMIAVAGRSALALAAHEAEIAREISELVGMSHADDPKAVEQVALSLKVQHKDLPVRIMQMQREVSELAGRLQATILNASGGIIERVDHLQSELKRLRKMADAKAAQSTASVAEQLLASIEQLPEGVNLLIAKVEVVDAKGLGVMTEALRARKPSLCVILGADISGKAALSAAVSKDLVTRGITAGEIIKRLAESIGGKGGGRPELAQAGAPEGARVGEALEAARGLVMQLIRS